MYGHCAIHSLKKVIKLHVLVELIKFCYRTFRWLC